MTRPRQGSADRQEASMRAGYRAELDAYFDNVVTLACRATSTMSEATRALLDVDPALASSVLAEEPRVRQAHDNIDYRALVILARQQPVATDLRTIIAGIRMSAHLQRMAALARHIAEIVRERDGTRVVPERFRETVVAMGVAAEHIGEQVCVALPDRDSELAVRIIRHDDRMDELLARLHRLLLDKGKHEDTVDTVNLTLIGRYYERFADHAAAIARRVIFLAGGPATLPRGTGVTAAFPDH
ncbi:phosphate signaling complex protein PhoU [Haloechinothrix sp. LS1_15]|uniref:phosphate signaling complex protein PhoU n=1 Tax=Haloechinothrix sp. LS1_15 TaxID=2652248 RepID=UPI00294B72FB|nr:phosphate signaling complex protein PhoU [Haloechinothrix sp. LS1_15]